MSQHFSSCFFLFFLFFFFLRGDNFVEASCHGHGAEGCTRECVRVDRCDRCDRSMDQPARGFHSCQVPTGLGGERSKGESSCGGYQRSRTRNERWFSAGTMHQRVIFSGTGILRWIPSEFTRIWRALGTLSRLARKIELNRISLFFVSRIYELGDRCVASRPEFSRRGRETKREEIVGREKIVANYGGDQADQAWILCREGDREARKNIRRLNGALRGDCQGPGTRGKGPGNGYSHMTRFYRDTVTVETVVWLMAPSSSSSSSPRRWLW